MRERNSVFSSRAVQTADFLRQKLNAGHWRGHLPSERALAAELGIGRHSLRSALAELHREGFFSERSRQGVRLAQKKLKKSSDRLTVGIIQNVSSRPGKLWSGKELIVADRMKRLMRAQNIELKVHQISFPKSDRLSRNFLNLFKDHSHACWILNAPTVSMQQWCQKHHIPAMIRGIAHHKRGLPFVGLDHYALGHHAAGEMLRLQHQHLAMILPQNERGEDELSRQGFQAGVNDSQHPEARCHFFHHNLTQTDICRLADRLLIMKPRPTAWLVCRQGHFLTLMTHLLYRGVQIPGEVSLISRDSEPFIDDIIPAPTRYTHDLEWQARRCARLAIKIATGQQFSEEQILTVPELVPGATLGRCPKQP